MTESYNLWRTVDWREKRITADQLLPEATAELSKALPDRH